MANDPSISGAITPLSTDAQSTSTKDTAFVDNRPIVSELLEEYREKISEFKTELSKDVLYDEKRQDELWMLRFLLSHKKDVDKALSAAKEALQLRKKYNLDAKDIRAVPPQDITEPNDIPSGGYHTYLENGVTRDAIRLTVPDPKSCGVVVYFSIKDIDTHKLGTMEKEDWVAGMVYTNEWQFQWNDHITRTTGRLTKSIHVIDVSEVQLSMHDSTTEGKYIAASRELQNCYPQGVQSYFVCNAPFWIQGPWNIMKLLLPVRVVSKLDFLNPKRYKSDQEKILRFIPAEQLPSQFGGNGA